MTTGNSRPLAACTVRMCTASSSVSSVVTLLRSSLSTRSATQRRYSPSEPPVCSNHQRASSSTSRNRRNVVTCAPSLVDAASELGWRAVSAGRVVGGCGDGKRAGGDETVGGVGPEAPDNSTGTVSACIGVARGLVDEWLSGRDPGVPVNLGEQTRLPAGHWVGERAAADILVLARKGRAFRSLGKLLGQQGGPQVLYGSAIALAAAIKRWADLGGTSVPDLTRTILR